MTLRQEHDDHRVCLDSYTAFDHDFEINHDQTIILREKRQIMNKSCMKGSGRQCQYIPCEHPDSMLTLTLTDIAMTGRNLAKLCTSVNIVI